MKIIRISRKLDSDRLHLPEIISLIGKTVEITVQETPAPREKNWQPLIDAAEQNLVDPEVYKSYRGFDRSENAAAKQ